MEFPALRALIAKAKARGVLTALDNTWGAGLAFCAFDYAVDVSVHALTKYPSGGADVLMGSIVTRDRALHLQLKSVHAQLGIGIAANDAELVLRNLPTLLLRYRQQDQHARQLADWLAQQPQIAQVLHPARPDNAGYAEWQAVCRQTDLAAGLFSVVFQSEITQAQVDQFCDALQLFKIGFSWGGPVSLVMGYSLQRIRPQQPAHLQHGCLVRLSIGLEHVLDLQQDLAQALFSMHNNNQNT
jgi:cystathionine beta-lyase